MSRGLLPRAVALFLLYGATLSAASFQTQPPVSRPGEPQSKPASSRIVAATNVTLRALPSTTAAAVAQLPLGTELTESGPVGMDRTWIRVKMADGREGWLRGNLTKPLDHAWRWPTFDRIIEERLTRKGDGFAAQAELVAFIDRISPEYSDPDGRARIDFDRLRAVQATLGAIPFGAGQREPYATFINAHKTEVTYDTPASRWLLSNQVILDLQTKHANTQTGDDIAWFAVTNGLPGECEGYIPCYLRWRNRLQGEYLRREPNGRHVEEAIALIKETADSLADRPKPNEIFDFDRARDCKDLSASVDALIGAIKATRSVNRDPAVASLGGVRKLCGM